MDTPTLHQLRSDIDRMLTCATAAPCPKEIYCFRVAKALAKLLPDPIVDDAPDPAPDPDVVEYYCCWESRSPDWSAS